MENYQILWHLLRNNILEDGPPKKISCKKLQLPSIIKASCETNTSKPLYTGKCPMKRWLNTQELYYSRRDLDKKPKWPQLTFTALSF